jgi:hypothetical protein
VYFSWLLLLDILQLAVVDSRRCRTSCQHDSFTPLQKHGTAQITRKIRLKTTGTKLLLETLQ